MEASKSFGGLKPDKNRTRIHTGGAIRTENGETGFDSPYSFNGTAVKFDIPADVAEVFFRPSVALRVSEDPLMGSYYTIPAGVCHPFGVTNLDALYIASDSAVVLNYYLVTVS